MAFGEWSSTVFLGNDLLKWGIALTTALVAFVALRLALRLVHGRLEKFSAMTETLMDDLLALLLKRTGRLFVFAWSLYMATHVLSLPPEISRLAGRVIILLTLYQVGIWGMTGIGFWSEHYMAARVAADPANKATIGLVSFVGKFLLYGMLFLIGLNNIGVDITALVAGLGVGGIAVALAVQNILGDLFASLTIVLDKPFVPGDAIKVGDHSGTIEHIGLKTTRIRSLSGEQLIFSNTDLLKSRIQNFKRMQERRVVFTLGVTYQTPLEKLRMIPVIVRQTIEKHSAKIRFERSHFRGYGASSLEFETVYWVKDPDYLLHMDLQQEINLELLERFNAEGIEFAYPTQTVLVKADPTTRGVPVARPQVAEVEA